MFILGLNAYHGDSAACLVRDGVLVAAAEEERFRRIKHWAGFPSEAIAYCLREAGIDLAEIDRVALNRDPGANMLRKLAFAARSGARWNFLKDRFRNARRWLSMEDEFARAFPGHRIGATIHHIEHHRAHLASAFYVSPFEEAAAVSVDGSGDFATACWGHGAGSKLKVTGRVFFPHSLGLFYQAVTQFLGFPHFGDEYKVMGLAPYGEPRFLDALRRVVRLKAGGRFELDLDCFQHHRGKSNYQWQNEAPVCGQLFSDRLESVLGKARQPEDPLAQRHRDIACSVQAMYEEAFFHLLNHVHRDMRCDNLVLSGGCGYNSVANGKIHLRSPFRHSYIQPASGDAGGAIGAAFALWHELGLRPRAFEMDHAYWGPSFDDGEIRDLLARQKDVIEGRGCSIFGFPDEQTLCDRVAAAIAAGKVVGWFQGRMEWGPRALGNRSILCDPRRTDMKELLNLKIKRRESFRPFAPSILREAVPGWFESDDDVPFMMKVFQVKPDRRALIPAVTHVDGSGRLQTVTRTSNPLYYRLIETFAELTGVPMLLNTSFNENEPVVCRPEEALDCFLRTRMDMLVLGTHMVARDDAVLRTSVSAGVLPEPESAMTSHGA